MIGTGGIARCRADAAILFLDQRIVGELLALGIAPERRADILVQPLGKGLGQAVGERFQQDVVIIVMRRLEALEMLVGTKTYKLLKGVRGEKSVDMTLVAECVQRISQLSMDFPQIMEMDINPLKVSTARAQATAVDARVRIAL